MSLKRRYKQYLAGGPVDPLSAVAMAQQLGTSLVDTLAPTNEFGHQGAIASALKGNMQLGTIGGVLGYINGRKQQQEDKLNRFRGAYDARNQQYARSGAIISADPALVTGYQGAELYADGGFLKKSYYDTIRAEGGTLKALSKTSAEVRGPSHAAGGVDLPAYSSELEGGETLQGDYVFSKRLGFAQQHKKLASAIGKIERKPATAERINSLKRLYQGIEDLKQQQEAIRQQYNLE